MKTLANFAQLCGGRLKGADGAYTTVSSDTRTLGQGALFVALRGPNFNGNEFVSAALAAGAAGALVDGEQPAALPQIIVADTQAALERAGNGWREQFTIPVVGVAGSNGKTTAKEMTAAILGEMGNCLATRGNLNNHIGVPLTLLRIDATHRFAVVEMGANRGGEVAALVRIARPTVGMITNAGAEHLEGFGSIEGVARAEGEMVEGLAPTATAVINADDEFADLWRKLTKAHVVTFGVHAPADFKAADVRTTIGPEGFLTHFTLVCPLGSTAIGLHMGGRHNVANALSAAAAAAAAGAKLEHIAAGLGAMRAVAGRLQFKKALGGAWIIDDSYNANPSSMRAGIEVLAELEGTKWLVIGDMAELGDYAPAAHTEVGEFARAHGIERLFAMGGLAKLAVDSFGAGAQWFPDAQSLAIAVVKALAGVTATGGVDTTANASSAPTQIAPAAGAAATASNVRLLIKGSRVNRLERVVDTLVHGSIQQTSGH
ncbi:MAG: UDP-N-acetylmuramoyl-tripeptide--D-alanyl-D-alanine ligase [Gammaproteobacteria bacterium]|nr:UDP-N-acetylmuramoyl-tripeptide--D-alanyl-D-alanine ligase [Gammaproteobacteria bacterium]